MPRPMPRASSARRGTSTSDIALEIPRPQNIDLIGESIAAVVARGREALFDAEHFFDGYKANPAYALDCMRAAIAGGGALGGPL